ncbi:MAG TPA: hypothetical protein VEA37_13965 [Flavobacterium sp.]|nr:hypothetical protein [Flavobacterium sp.]
MKELKAYADKIMEIREMHADNPYRFRQRLEGLLRELIESVPFNGAIEDLETLLVTKPEFREESIKRRIKFYYDHLKQLSSSSGDEQQP